MKSLLLTICIAALTTSANAKPWAAFYCGKDQREIEWLPPKYFDPRRAESGAFCFPPCDGKHHYFDNKKDPDHKRPLSNSLFRMSADGNLFYKGKKCLTEKEYDASR